MATFAMQTAFADDPYWTGSANDLKLGTAGNWSTGSVPTSGNVVISLTEAATLTNDEGSQFAPTAITFSDSSAIVTISGEKSIEGLLAITNSASVHHVFNCPVAFADNTDADLTASSSESNYIKYPGGMTMYKPMKSSSIGWGWVYLSGQITITADIEDWSSYQTIDMLQLSDSGTKLVISHSVEVKGVHNFRMDEGTMVEIQGDYTVSSPSTVKYGSNNYAADSFAYVNKGIIKATGKIATGAADVRFGAGASSSSGAMAANKFDAPHRFIMTCFQNNGGSLVVGEGGMTASNNGDFYLQASANRSSRLVGTIRPSANFAVNATIRSAPGRGLNGKVLFNTTDYYDSSIGRTITVNNAVTDAVIDAVGTGTLLFNVSGGTSLGLWAANSCTVAVNSNCQPGTGLVVLSDSAALKVAESGTVTLGGELRMNSSNASLEFNFTDRATAPKLIIPTLNFVSGVSTVNVKISADDDRRPVAGEYVIASSTSGNFTGKTINVTAPYWVESVTVNSSGELVCNVKPSGLIISVH